MKTIELTIELVNEYHWRVKQDGLVVASGTCKSVESRDIEASRYAFLYSQEGDITVEYRETGSRWRFAF